MYFRCIVTDKYGNSVTTDPAQMFVGGGVTITAQPEDAYAPVGSNVSFHVAASGEELAYKWQYSARGVSWADATKFTGWDTDTVEAKLLATRDGMYFRCIVTDKYGNSETSDPAQMFAAGASITSQPEDVYAAVGSCVSFHVDADGEDLTYKWQYSARGVSWADATKFTGWDTDTVEAKLLATRDGMYFRCIVTDKYGNSETSDPAQMFIS